MQLECRVAAPDECEVVSAILLEAAAWLAASGRAMWKAHELAPDAIRDDVARGCFFLAWQGAEAAATVRLTHHDPLFWPEAVPGEALYVHRLAVRRAFAGGAATRALLACCAERARANAARFLRLDCAADRPSLRAVYERAGFRYHSEQRVGPFVMARYERALREA